MLKTLKYDIKTMFRSLWLLWMLCLVWALVYRIVALFEGSWAAYLGIILQFTGTALAIGSILSTIIYCWRSFLYGFYGKAAFVRHMLPVSFQKTTAAWLLATAAAVGISLTVSFASLWLLYGKAMDANAIASLLPQGISFPAILCMVFVTVWLEAAYSVFCGYAGIIIGHRRPSHKLAVSILWGIGFYLAGQLLILAVAFLGLHSTGILEMETDLLSGHDLAWLIFAGAVLYGLLDLGYGWICMQQMRLGVDL